ncbi:cytochrome P450 [Auriculariales sp. MPI-PUGE-AT-0066]|nr:cytochrome P450 [Auriculariales sp. MPI-PUGE-AT-0066]
MGQALSVDTGVALLLSLGALGLIALLTRENHGNVPTIGVGSGLLAVNRASTESVTKINEWIFEGYRKYKAGVFKVRIFRSWNYIVSSSRHVDELRKAPDDTLSFSQAVNETMEAQYTMGKHFIVEGILLTKLVKARLTRSLAGLFPVVTDEIAAAFTDEITSKLNGNEWHGMTIVPQLMRVVCRTSNRIFVGCPYVSRDKDYVSLNVQYTIDLFNSAQTIRRWPRFLKPFVGRYLTPLPHTMQLARKAMSEELERRKRETEEHGQGEEWDGKPNDFLQWILDAGDANDLETEVLMRSLLRLNFAAIHTTALSFTFALYHVAAEPEKYQEVLRQEAHEILSKHGWTKTAMENMHKTDSILRESQRFHGLGSLSMTRKAMQDFTFSDGTHLRKGDMLSVASRPVHLDDSVYPSAATFDGFRFFNQRTSASGDGEVTMEDQLVNIGPGFLSFGIGRHACPGRFWAANEMKAMMAYMVTHYDFKMENEGVLPSERWNGPSVIPDPLARLVFRKRETTFY